MTVWESLDATRDPAELALMVVMVIFGAAFVGYLYWICTNDSRKDG